MLDITDNEKYIHKSLKYKFLEEQNLLIILKLFLKLAHNIQDFS